ncbi:dihydropteroate synthase [Candidatus Peregrinibacteria bacterium]|nr:dihydropteroate synthase [Candidatus Peregrinibacteria bacterium]
MIGKGTLVMGVLNVTPDSFSDGSRFFQKDKAIRRGIKMAQDGANIIDIGGESTRPNARPVGEKEELRRIIPVIEKLSSKTLVSVDTYKPKVAQEAIEAGAKIINDITGLANPKMAEVASKYRVPIIIMHIKGTPRNMQKNPSYKNVIGEIMEYFSKRIKRAFSYGIHKSKILIDPGIGFGKRPQDNIEILRRLGELAKLGYPIVVGTSRKSFIGYYLGKNVNQRLMGTAATVATAVFNGADIVRVHDVKEMVDVVKMVDLIKRRNLCRQDAIS